MINALSLVLGIITDPLFIAGIFLCALVLHKAFHRDEKLAVLAGFLGAVLLVAGVTTAASKGVFQVPRPCAGTPSCPADYAFPSGHAAISFAFFSFLFFLNGRWKSSEIILLFPFMIALSRVMQGVHTVVDVTAGAVLGTAIGFALYKLHEGRFLGGRGSSAAGRRRRRA